MPLFPTPKPRQFRYQPRFYDPEKERWEALKQKYADEQAAKQASDDAPASAEDVQELDKDLEYFQRKDLFRKREMPTFNYTPRFQTENQEMTTGEHIAEFKKRNVKIKRRFDISDTDYMKPVPATRIMLYVALVCMLLYWILF